MDRIMLTDTQILDHLSAASPLYLEIDEPDGMVKTDRDTNEFIVQRRRPGSRCDYVEIHRCRNFREALDAAISYPDPERSEE